jgi:plastocyanin
MDTILGVAATFIIPDWNALLALFPILLGALFLVWFAFTARKYATLGPRRRAPARVEPITPAHVHMPGGSAAPIVVAFGAAFLFAGLVVGGVALAVGATIMVITLLVWGREAIRDYSRIEPAARGANRLPAIVHEGPPPGVHMPGPSIRPLMGALGSAALLGGLVIGGWVLILAIVFLVWTLIGWLVDFTAEYRKVEDADRTGHLENIPPKPLPMRALQVFAVAFALLGLWQLGIFPPAAPATAGGPEATGEAGGPAGAPPGAKVVVAKTIAFEQKTLEVEAGKPFTIFLENQDPASVPHDIDLHSADGSQLLKDQPTIPGGTSKGYEFDALQPGTYQYICSVHSIPAMTGTLTVK